MNIESIFIEKLGEPFDRQSFCQYVNLIKNYDSNLIEEYYEDHHILPRSVFPEYKNESENIIRLRYEDHVLCHVLLFKSYPIRKFEWVIRFMKEDFNSEEYLRYRKECSIRGWKNLKSDKEKYDSWRKKRSEYVKSNPIFDVMDEHKRKELFEYFKSEEHSNNCRDIANKYWNSDDSNQHRDTLRNMLSGLSFEERSSRSTKMWENKSEEQKTKELERLKKDGLNGSRIGADIIKEKWKDPEFRKEMKIKQSGNVLWNNGIEQKKSKECPGDGWIRGSLYNIWNDPEIRKKILESRSGSKWWNNGIDEIKSKTKPEGYVSGRLRRNK